jgi:hypothetical protein
LPLGFRLSTLREAGAYLSQHFSAVTQSAVLEHAIELLMAAARAESCQTERPRTDQVARVLHGRGLV